ENTNLTQTINDLKSQLDSLLNASKIKKSTKDMSTGSNNNLPYGEDGQVISGDDLDSPTFPNDVPYKNLNPKETMQALGIANRMMGNLRANLQKEKSEKYELKELLDESREQIEAMRAAGFDDLTLLPNLSKSNNELTGEYSDMSDSDAFSTSSGKIRGNRPSSDWFKKTKRKPSGRSLLSRESADVDISEIMGEPGSYDDTSRNSDLRRGDTLVRRRVTEYEDISKQIADDDIVIHRGSSQSSKYGDAKSPSDVKSPNDVDGKSPSDVKGRTSTGSSHLEERSQNSNQNALSSKIDSSPTSPTSPTTRSIPNEIITPKEIRHIGVQTDSVERSDSMSTFGNKRGTSVFDDASQDSKTDPTNQHLTVPDKNENKRFTLDL
ncbi:18042_t:CDS:2, partial [Gigaspora rosea]